MAPFSKGDKCDQSFKIGTMENRLALLKPLQNENYKTVVSTYASEFPRREVKNAKCQPFIHHPATEISKDSGHFSQLTTETKRQYEEKLSFLKPPVCPDRVKLTSVQMHSDKRISPFYQTSHKLEFPGKLPIKKREMCVPSLATGNRVLARDEKQLPIESEQQEKFKGERNKDFDIAEKSDKTKSIRVPIQGDNCKRYQTTNESTFQGKWYPPVSKAASWKEPNLLTLQPTVTSLRAIVIQEENQTDNNITLTNISTIKVQAVVWSGNMSVVPTCERKVLLSLARVRIGIAQQLTQLCLDRCPSLRYPNVTGLNPHASYPSITIVTLQETQHLTPILKSIFLLNTHKVNSRNVCLSV